MLSNIYERKSILKRVPRTLKSKKNNKVMPIAPSSANIIAGNTKLLI